MKTLQDLLKQAKLIENNLNSPFASFQIQDVKCDSRNIEPFDLFVSIPCPSALDYIQESISKECKVFIVEPEIIHHPLFKENSNLFVFSHYNPRYALALLAAAFYDKQPDHIVAVTGTNGKSSTVHYVRQFWDQTHLPCANIGTLGLYVSAPDEMKKACESIQVKSSLTTLDALSLHKLMNEIKAKGINYLAFEASSHGLDQYRIQGTHLEAAGFTNLTQDHLDYHQTLDDYFYAKSKLFSEVLPPYKTAVLNADSPYFNKLAEICNTRNQQIIDFSKEKKAYLQASNIRYMPKGQCFDLYVDGKVYKDLSVPVYGDFQIENILCAIGLALGTGVKIEDCINALSTLTAAKGRLECVSIYNEAAFFVDYAHTPDALEKSLKNLRPYVQNSLWVIFGCGGNRDSSKRPIMGKIAQAYADKIIVTDDNPRYENPDHIRSQILSACPQALEIGNRKEAIYYAIENAKPGDVILIAGKGHEQGQTIGSATFPFDDTEVVINKVREA